MPRIVAVISFMVLICTASLSVCGQVADSTYIPKDSIVTTITDTLRQVTDTTHVADTPVTHTDTLKPEIPVPAPKSGYLVGGRILDRNTGEGIPFATIFFPSSPVGTSADLDGHFQLPFSEMPSDTLRVQAMGYNTYNRVLDRNRKQYTLNIELERSEAMLDEVVIHAGEDPALILLKKIIARKPFNDPDRVQNYKYEVYNKLEVDLERLTKEQFEKLPIPMMRKFSFIYDNLDTVSEDRPFLPLYLTETISDYYYQKEPKRTKEFIHANQLKGINYESVTKFLGSMYQNVNPYGNYIPVFDKQFVSPISNSGAFFYKYSIIDTQEAYGHRIILVQYRPKRDGENCFYGDFWVVDSVYSMQRINMELPKAANLNWVSRVSLYQEYAPVGDTLWFLVKDRFNVSFVAPYNLPNMPGFIGRKTTSYRDIVVNDYKVYEVLSDKNIKPDVVVNDSARFRDNSYWATARHDSLSKNEKAIYQMIDTLQSMPMFIRYKNMIKFFASGVKEFGPIELGPYWYVYSRNPIEGHRFRFSMGTTPKLFKDIYLNGYAAYGTTDKRLKYSAAGLWLLNRQPRMYLYASYVHDIDRSTNYYDEVSTDNIFSVAIRKKGIPWKLAFVDETKLEFHKEYYSGFSHMLTLNHREYDPYEPLPSGTIFRDVNGDSSAQVVSTEASMRLRFAYKERFLEGNYFRVSMGSAYPVVEVKYAMGLKGVWNSNYEYHRVTASISDNVKIAPLGSFYFNIFGGKYFGKLPYALLQVHPGNEFYYYNRYTFNMMNQYEFISDEYAGFNFEHSIGGGIFKYIPLLKKLKLRQFWNAKGVIGSLSDENKALNLNKGFEFKTLERNPYIEVGTGIENILQFFRIDFVWRVAPERKPGEPFSKYFGVFGSVKFNF